MPPQPLRSARGQASADYVALLTVVLVVLGGAATAIAAPQLAPSVVATVQRGICLVSGSVCSAADARAAGLGPCPVRSRSDRERAGGRAAIVRLDRDDAVLVEERSDGTVAVSFVDGWRGGLGVGIGLRIPGGGAMVGADAGVDFTGGRTYELGSRAEAARFLARHAREETLKGEGRRLVRRLCRRCARTELPPPSATYHEGGLWAEVAAEAQLSIRGGRASVPLGAQAALDGAALLGRRTAGARKTWYVKLEAEVVAGAGLLMASMQVGGDRQVVLELSEERGRLVEARLRSAAGMAAAVDLPAGAGFDLATAASWIRSSAAPKGSGGGGGLRLDAAVALDLRDPANRRALLGFLGAAGSPLEIADRVRALGRRLDVAGAVDLDLSRTSSSTAVDEAIALGPASLGYERVEEASELIAAWSLRAGGALRRREDCESAPRAKPVLRASAPSGNRRRGAAEGAGSLARPPWSTRPTTSPPPSATGSRRT